MANLNDLEQSFFGGGNINDAQAALYAGNGPSTFNSAMRAYIRMNGTGLKGWNYPVDSVTTNTAIVTGTVYYALMPFIAGDIVTHFYNCMTTAGAGLTLARVGINRLSDSALLASSGDLSASFNGATGNIQCTLSSPWTCPVTGDYWTSFVNVGTTGATISRCQNVSATFKVFGSNSTAFFGSQTGQTDLPNPGTITFTGTALGLWWGWD